ncbi:MAG TPA: hypothetical protein VK541_14775 [Pedobacter sp.]|uniref:hypothetical protein n=1 Tax=Pedobacter sp. TaxID=1411316 RepID=UPI002C725F7A|nr:hypothetical protein [Pedobacter sp.]HMI03745.1 hypothetical protein [Pedobacter sp.]
MSILDFLKGVLRLFIDNFPAFVKRLFNKIPDELRNQLQVIIQVVENIKQFVDSPGADILTSLIPGTADDKLKEWLRKVLPEILDHLGMITDAGLKLSEDPDTKAAQLHSVATILNRKLTGASFGQAAITTEVVYQNS